MAKIIELFKIVALAFAHFPSTNTSKPSISPLYLVFKLSLLDTFIVILLFLYVMLVGYGDTPDASLSL